MKWDEATAVLAGDALQTLAFEILAAPQGGIDPRLQARLVLRLAQAAGAHGMVGGQALDIAAEKAPAPLDLDGDHRPAGAEDRGAVRLGGGVGGDPRAVGHRSRCAAMPARFGLAFQIRDDILDVEGDAEAAGKRLRKDEERGKATFVSLLGLERRAAKAHELVAEACDSLAPYGSAAGNLRAAAQFVLARGR